MGIPSLQTISHRQGKVDLTLTVRHTENMTGWSIAALLTKADGTTVTKSTGSGITIVDGPNGTGTDCVIDYTDGTSYGLPVGTHNLQVGRTGSGVRDDIAQASYVVGN